MRRKRDAVQDYRGRRMGGNGHKLSDFYPAIRMKRKNLNSMLETVMIRRRRELSDIERAYTKYFEKIKEKYKSYVKTLLNHHRLKNDTSHMTSFGVGGNHITKNIAYTNNNHSMGYKPMTFDNNPELLERYNKAPQNHKTRIITNDFLVTDETHDDDVGVIGRRTVNDEEMYKFHRLHPEFGRQVDLVPIAIPNINDQVRSMNSNENNYRNHFNLNQQKFDTNEYDRDSNNYDRNSVNLRTSDSNRTRNISSIIAQLKSQIVRRRKRSAAKNDNEGRTEQRRDRLKNRGGNKNHTVPVVHYPDGEETFEAVDNGKRGGKPKAPCEEIVEGSYMTIHIVRPGRDMMEPYSSGTIIKAICSKGYSLNLANANGTAKCVRGRWKPLTPVCEKSEF